MNICRAVVQSAMPGNWQCRTQTFFFAIRCQDFSPKSPTIKSQVAFKEQIAAGQGYRPTGYCNQFALAYQTAYLFLELESVVILDGSHGPADAVPPNPFEKSEPELPDDSKDSVHEGEESDAGENDPEVVDVEQSLRKS